MKALALCELDKHDIMTIEVEQLTEENKEILISSAKHYYNTLAPFDKRERLFEVRIIDIVKDEEEEQGEELKRLFEKAGLKGYMEDYNAQGYDVIFSIGVDVRI